MRALTLIGMPGSGKTAVGKIIADRLGWHFLDTDRLIESAHGVPLQEVIDRVGDSRFRELEEEAVLQLSIAHPTVISTGGSVIYSDRAMGRLSEISTIVFLDATLEAVRSHIASEAPRGIIGMPKGGLEELYRERVPRYRRYAHITVHLGTENEAEAAAVVLSALRLDREEH